MASYFGWPRAHEDDAERAISAGLGILKAVRSMTAKQGITLPRAVKEQLRLFRYT